MEGKEGLQNEVQSRARLVALTRKGFVEDLLRLSQSHPSLLWEEKIVEFAPEVSDFYLTTDRSATVVVSVRDGFEGARVMLDEHVFEFVPTSELYEFLAAVLEGDWEMHPRRGFWRPSRMEVHRGDQRWVSD